jgi:hypothetical protein
MFSAEVAGPSGFVVAGACPFRGQIPIIVLSGTGRLSGKRIASK